MIKVIDALTTFNFLVYINQKHAPSVIFMDKEYCRFKLKT